MVRLSDKGWAIYNARQPLQPLSLYPHKPDVLSCALVMQTPDHFGRDAHGLLCPLAKGMGRYCAPATEQAVEHLLSGCTPGL